MLPALLLQLDSKKFAFATDCADDFVASDTVSLHLSR
jgi:hypothetical protein